MKLRALVESKVFLLALLLLMLVVYVATQTRIRRDPRPTGSARDIRALARRDDLDVVFILVDTLRSDHLHAYGYERETSPLLDYLASSGARFAQHHSQSSWTKASMASLWTSLLPNRTGVLRAQDALSQEAVMPAEILHDAGYLTVGIWRNGWVAPNFGFSQGFDIYQSPRPGQAPAALRRKVRAGRITGTDIDAVYSAAEFLRTHWDQRFFLYMHLMDVHQYVSDASTAVFGSNYADSYDNAVLWVDRQIGGVIAQIERLGLRDRTLIVIASDHGEAFGEHGFEGHAKDIYSEVTTVPFVLSFPFRLERGIVVEDASSNVDIWPTILDLIGLARPAPSDGRSRVPALLASGTTQRNAEHAVFAELDRSWGKVREPSKPVVAVQVGSERLIRELDTPPRQALYDLSIDPFEQDDLSEKRRDTLGELSGRLDRYLEQGVAFEAGTPRVELDDMELRQLRALGYAVE